MSPKDPTSDVSPRTGGLPAVRVRVDLPGSVTLAVTGDLDDAGAAVLDRALLAASDADHRRVTVDLCRTTSLGVAAARALLDMHARSRSRGRALRILVTSAHSARLLTGEGLGSATQLCPPGPAVPDGQTPAAGAPPPDATSAEGCVRGRHLSLVRPATRPSDLPAIAEQEPPSSEAAVSLLHWAASLSTCVDVPTVVSAVAEEAWRSLAEVELVEVEVLDGPEGRGWSGSAGRGRIPSAVVGRNRSQAVAALTTGSRGTILSLRLDGVGTPVVGSLIVSSTTAISFGHQTWEGAHLFAALAAGVLAGARHRHHMALALEHRDVLGQATGMLMERHGFSSGRAFAALSHASSVRGVQVSEVASSLIRTGEL